MNGNTKDVLITLIVIAAAVTLIVTGNGGWVVAGLFIAWLALT